MRRGCPTPAIAAARAAGLAVVLPARARDLDQGDPDQVNVLLTGVCDAALTPALAALEVALPHATEAERALIGRHREAAREACATGDPEAGARTAARLARLAGRIEARAGLDAGGPAALLAANN